MFWQSSHLSILQTAPMSSPDLAKAGHWNPIQEQYLVANTQYPELSKALMISSCKKLESVELKLEPWHTGMWASQSVLALVIQMSIQWELFQNVTDQELNVLAFIILYIISVYVYVCHIICAASVFCLIITKMMGTDFVTARYSVILFIFFS